MYMLKDEWKSLLHNKILLIVVFAIIAIPTIYAGLFLASMWDPYGSLEHLPVAVVNRDRPVEYGDTTLKVGDEMVESLKENDSMAFNFVDSGVAESGLKNGTYYMVITIPENFSENASTLMDDKPQKMELKYETNPGTNYIASKMSESAMTKIKDSVAQEVTKVYTETVFDQIASVGDGMQDAADGAGELKDGVVKVSDGNQTITENLEKLASSTLDFKDGSDTLTEGLKEYTAGVSQVNDGAKELKDGVGTLTAKVPELTDGTKTLNDGVKEYTSGVAKLSGNSGSLTDGTKQLKEGAATLKTGAASLYSGTQEYVNGANTLADGTAAYVAGAEKLAAGAKQLAPLQNLGQVSSGISQLNTAVSKGTGESVSLKSGTQQLEDGLAQMNEQIGGLAKVTSDEGLKTLAAGLKSAKEGMSTASAGMNKASDGMTSASAGIQTAGSILSDKVIPGLQSVPEQFGAVADNVNQVFGAYAIDVNTKIGTANAQISTGQQGVSDAAAALESLKAAAESGGEVTAEALNDIISTLNTTSAGMTGVDSFDTTGYQAAVGQIADGVNAQMENTQKDLQAAVTGLNTIAGALDSGAKDMSDGAQVMKDGASQMDAGAAQIPDNIPDNPLPTVAAAVKQLYAGAKQVNAGTGAVAQGLDTLETSTASFPTAAAGIGQLNDGFAELTANDDTLKAGAKSLKTAGTSVLGGAKQVSEGAASLASGGKTLDGGVKEYTAGVTELNSNSKKLTDGTQALADGAGTLAQGANQLASGTSELYSGTSKLVSNNSTLNSGASQLADGAEQIQDGSSQLYDGSKELGDGIGQLNDGSATLAASLSDGADEVKEAKASDDTIDMFAAPIEDEETQITKVENNGHAMAPYMMSVGLWVGCLAFCLMYPLTKYNGKLKSGFSWWASKASVLYPVAILQGISLILLLHLFDGFTPQEMGKTILFAGLTAVAFTSIMYFFNVTLGKVGSFLMLIFMVVQLAGSAGTYPVEISPGFVAKIHNYLPFTYTVNAFRSTICGGESISGSVAFLVVVTIIFTILTVLEFQYRAKVIKQGKPLLLDFLEEKGLA